jgi:hypothetical protein
MLKIAQPVFATAICILQLGCGNEPSNDTNQKLLPASAGAGVAGISSPFPAIGPITITGAAGSLDLSAFQLMCDAKVESVASCGANTCPALAGAVASSCTVNCCTADGQCGTRVTDPRYSALGCVAPLQTVPADPRCPTTTMFGVALAGCCDAQGHCGQVFGPSCVAVAAGRACDAPQDAGM